MSLTLERLVIILLLGICAVAMWSAYEADKRSIVPAFHNSGEFLPVEPGTSRIDGRTYVNTAYGIEITFPEGWELSEADLSSGRLIEARRPTHNLYARLNAGYFNDLTTEEPDKEAFWRISKNIHAEYATDGLGISYSSTKPIGFTDYAGYLIELVSYWSTQWGEVITVIENFLAFGSKPRYFTLQLGASGLEHYDETYISDINAILGSIRLTAPQPME